MTQALGRLLLMPNALDLGAEEVPLTDVLASGVITQASKLLHWVVEDARSARAFLNRVNRIAPLAQPLQQTLISELPRTPKGPQRVIPGKPAKGGSGPARPETGRASPWEMLQQRPGSLPFFPCVRNPMTCALAGISRWAIFVSVRRFLSGDSIIHGPWK